MLNRDGCRTRRRSNSILIQDEASNVDGLPLRELKGLYKALQTTRGEIVNNLAKLSEIDEEIKDLEKVYKNARDRDNEHPQEVENIRQRLKYLKEQRAFRLEAASINARALRTQINRIKETLYRILNEDNKLRDNINTLFREQGVTIVSILTAISLAISTIVASIVLIGDVHFVKRIVADIATRITGEEISASNKHLDQNGRLDDFSTRTRPQFFF